MKYRSEKGNGDGSDILFQNQTMTQHKKHWTGTFKGQEKRVPKDNMENDEEIK
jgi:hypothetical protein